MSCPGRAGGDEAAPLGRPGDLVGRRDLDELAILRAERIEQEVIHRAQPLTVGNVVEQRLHRVAQALAAPVARLEIPHGFGVQMAPERSGDLLFTDIEREGEID